MSFDAGFDPESDVLLGRILELKRQGYCCSQLVATIAGLDPLGEENEGLITALRGLCFGLSNQKVCGALTGGICALSLHMREENLKTACITLTEWFETRFSHTSCGDLIGRGGVPTLLCMDAIKETSEKCLEMLVELDLL
jgi:hypothetical protein